MGGYGDRRRRLFAPSPVAADPVVAKAGGESDGETVVDPASEEPDDARTLAVLFDEQGERYRSWRKAVRNLSEHFYEDWPLEGPKTTLWLTKHIERTGGTLTLWFQRYLSESSSSHGSDGS